MPEPSRSSSPTAPPPPSHAAFPLISSPERLRLPDPVGAVVFDFDGVFTDNAVYVSEDGRETVRCDRGDGMGITQMRGRGVPMLVLSKEPNPVVARRCEKLRLPCLHGIDDKPPALRSWLAEQGVEPGAAVYVGNDVNDLGCFEVVGCAIAPADAHPAALASATAVLRQSGGRGAVRELCDAVLAQLDRAV